MKVLQDKIKLKELKIFERKNSSVLAFSVFHGLKIENVNAR